ncbi:hypothetical protein ACOTTU_23360 [Roseobacter sp. EG26]|uniref:hypothetical protein n=1 Tax=Roseobacter sp. EG26 TaxID=3412477 RepID=UPI003CE45A27
MSVYDDIKKMVTVLKVLEEVESKQREQGVLIAQLKDRILVLEAREDAVILSAKEAARQAFSEQQQGQSNDRIGK